MRVLVAMSGGVDSAVAAARVVDAGHEVVGVHLALSRGASGPAGGGTGGGRGCCTAEDARDARRAADVLGIPFYVWDFSERFAADVVDDFVAEYAAGRTPNPCVRCNQEVKFSALLDRALALGFDAVATGHYARVVGAPAGDLDGTGGGPAGDPTGGGPVELHRARDTAKDQSYVLAVLPPERLERSLFPLGDAPSKHDVREEAARRGLGVADKPDSADICFIPDGDTRAWLGTRIPRRPGAVLDASGAVVGRHDGAEGFTTGQRRGLHLGVPAADGRPRYVVATDVVAGTVVVGSAEELLVDEVEASGSVWCGAPAVVGQRLGAQLRAHGRELACAVVAVGGDGTVRLRFDEPTSAVAPGQLVALYDGTRVVGSATLDRSHRAAAELTAVSRLDVAGVSA